MHYDAIVIGAGGVGSAALYHLARRGVRVVGIDRFPPGHDRGSSHGQTRIIRMAYFEHPNYVPLLRRSYELWRELEEVAGKKLLFQTGMISCGPPEGETISGILRSAADHQLPVQRLTAREATARWPGFAVPDNYQVVFEEVAGYLMVEDCVCAHIDAAIRAGATLEHSVEVRGWKLDGRVVTVETDEGTLSADRLIVTAGAWASDLLATLKASLTVLRKPLFWYRPMDHSYHVEEQCPCFFFETPGGFYYGFPQRDEQGVKVAEHSGGDVVADPLAVDRTLHEADKCRVETFLSTHLPKVSNDCTAHSVCMYTMSPDGHFIVGLHPQYPQVVFTAGLSGHGFKFTSVLGEIMAELAIDGQTLHNIDFLSPTRFA